jgi:hypothetical protein
MPHEQRGVIGPLQVVDDHDGGAGRAQLVRQRDQDLDTGNGRVAVGEQPEPPAAEQVGGVRPARVARTEPYLKAVPHHAQRQPLGELVCDPPADVPIQPARSRQGLGDQGRLADAGLALDPDRRSPAGAQSLDAGTEGRELLAAVHPLRRPVDGPHGCNVCPARRQCLLDDSRGQAGQQPPYGAVRSAGMTISRFWILPVGPLGSASAIHTWRGYLYAATWPLT